jgi:hypothetical protein
VAIETIRLKDVEIEKNPLRVDVGAVLLGVIILEEGHHTNETTPPAAAP